MLGHLIGPEAIKNGEIYSAANDREQAAQVFKVAAQMVRADPELLALVKVVDSTKSIACYGNGSFYRAISAEAGTKHGLNPTVVIFDELAQAKSRELYDVLDTSMGARAEPLFVTISTQSNDPEHILSKLIDDGLNAGDPTICVHLYAVPDDCPDIFDPKVWKLANPALGDFRSAADFKALADKARRMPADEPSFRNLFLNQRFSADTPLIARVDWKACQGDAGLKDGEEIYLALDNASTTDLAALVAVSAKDGDRVAAWFWKPQALVEEHSRRDFGTGTRRYEEWAEAGWLDLTPGRSIQPAFIVAKVAELAARYRVLGLAYDRWRIADFLRHLGEEGVVAHVDEGDGIRLVAWGQGFRDMAPAVDAFERAVLDGKLRHPGSPVLTWNVGNAVVVTDPAGNRKLDKAKARFRIDGAIATAMALGLKARDAVDTFDAADWIASYA